MTRITYRSGVLIWISFVLAAAFAVVSAAQQSGGKRSQNPIAPETSAMQARLAESYGKLPLSFEANAGQTDPRVKFLSRGRGYTLFLTADEAVLALRTTKSKRTEDRNSKSAVLNLQSQIGNRQSTAPAVVRMKLVGADPAAKVSGLDELPGRSNYLIGNDPKKWRTNVPNHAEVKYKGIYPGVDLVYYGNQRQLEYDFVVRPGADPKAIRLEVVGADLGVRPAAGQHGDEGAHGGAPLRIDANGDLVLKPDSGDIRFHKPVAYQTDSGGRRRYVQAHYVLKPRGRVGIRLGRYDAARPLVIDPVLSYSTYLGGSSDDLALGIAVDSSGNAYVTGVTRSPDFPTVNPIPGACQGSCGSGSDLDAFVTKLNAAGSALVYSTYLGGSGLEEGVGIAVDSSGDAYVTGATHSTDFPTVNPVPGACQGSCGSGSDFDAFVTKLNAAGSALVYSTYLGGSAGEGGSAIAVDGSGNAWVTGPTNSSDFPTVNPVPGACQGSCGSGNHDDAFVTKLNAAGSALVYSTYLGGSGEDNPSGIAVDGLANAYVTGGTNSTDFPTVNPVPGACQGTCGTGSNFDAFVTKLNAAGSALVYSTYLGGSSFDDGLRIAVDGSGDVYVTGVTLSSDFPTVNPVPGACQGSCGSVGNGDAFVTKLNAAGPALVYSTYLGGSNFDEGLGIAVDGFGNAYVTGFTFSSDFPTVNPIPGACQGSCGTGRPNEDAFVTKVDAAGSALVYSTYLGGSSSDGAEGIAVDSAGNAYVAGGTSSTNFPVTPGTFQTTFGGGASDAFVAKISSVTQFASFSPTLN